MISLLRPLSLAALLVSVPAAAAAQMMLGNVQLTIGSPKDQVLAALAARNYTVSDLGNDAWSVATGDGATFQGLGMVRFTEGRLTFAKRDWFQTVGGGSPADVVRGIIGALNAIQPSPGVACTFAERNKYLPDGQVIGMDIQCGFRRINLSVIHSRGEDAVMISELLE